MHSGSTMSLISLRCNDHGQKPSIHHAMSTEDLHSRRTPLMEQALPISIASNVYEQIRHTKDQLDHFSKTPTMMLVRPCSAISGPQTP